MEEFKGSADDSEETAAIYAEIKRKLDVDVESPLSEVHSAMVRYAIEGNVHKLRELI